MLTRLAASLVTRAGYALIPPGYERGVIAGYVVADAARYVTADTTTERVVPIDARVFPPAPIPQPGLYRATRGRAHERYLLNADATHVRYSGEQPGVVEVTRGTWERWVQRSRAQAVPGAGVCEMEVEQ